MEENSKTRLYSIKQFDKSITFIASGAFGLSFAFIKDIIPKLHEASYKISLIIAWICFSLAICINLIAHYISMIAHQWALENDYLNDKSYNNRIKKWNKCIRCLNFSGILGIILGCIFLIFFIAKNL